MLQGDVGEDVVDRAVGDHVKVGTRAEHPLHVADAGEVATAEPQHLVRHVQGDHPSVQLGEPVGHATGAAADLPQRLVLRRPEPAEGDEFVGVTAAALEEGLRCRGDVPPGVFTRDAVPPRPGIGHRILTPSPARRPLRVDFTRRHSDPGTSGLDTQTSPSADALVIPLGQCTGDDERAMATDLARVTTWATPRTWDSRLPTV